MRAIYADGQPVGFVLTFDEPSEGYFLWRFTIAEGHQRRGIGRHAMRLYESLGFRLTGEEEDGELVMSLDM